MIFQSSNIDWAAFMALIVESPPALLTLGLVTFIGYGISFVLFDYRSSKPHASHKVMHIVFGLGYAAVMFCLVNFDLLRRAITADEIISRLPVTLLASFTAFFVMILPIIILKEIFRSRSNATSPPRTGS